MIETAACVVACGVVKSFVKSFLRIFAAEKKGGGRVALRCGEG
jgi:hypothetical protein